MSYEQLTREERFVIYHSRLVRLSVREIARRLNRFRNARFRQGLAEEVHEAFPKESFDLVYSFAVLEHVRDVDETIRSIMTVLRPGGRFCFVVPMHELRARRRAIKNLSIWTPSGAMRAAPWMDIHDAIRQAEGELDRFVFNRNARFPSTRPVAGDEAIWDGHTSIHNPMMDREGRVWFTARIRPAGAQPKFITSAIESSCMPCTVTWRPSGASSRGARSARAGVCTASGWPMGWACTATRPSASTDRSSGGWASWA